MVDAMRIALEYGREVVRRRREAEKQARLTLSQAAHKSHMRRLGDPELSPMELVDRPVR
jgi:hypothetical protein